MRSRWFVAQVKRHENDYENAVSRRYSRWFRGWDSMVSRSARTASPFLMTSFFEDGKGGLPGITGVVEFIASLVRLAEGRETRGLTHLQAEVVTVLHCALEVLNRVLGVAREEMCDSDGVQRVTGREAVAAAGAERVARPRRSC